MKNYKISIITVTKNSEKFLPQNILSVKSQKYKNFEHIIVDGNSKDKTIKIINSHKKSVKLIKNKKDKGLYHAMNVGIKRSSGDIIGILNSDDIYFRNTLKIVNKYFNKYDDLDFYLEVYININFYMAIIQISLIGALDFTPLILLAFL